jgi:hypothetical protein
MGAGSDRVHRIRVRSKLSQRDRFVLLHVFASAHAEWGSGQSPWNDIVSAVVVFDALWRVERVESMGAGSDRVHRIRVRSKLSQRDRFVLLHVFAAHAEWGSSQSPSNDIVRAVVVFDAL